LIQRWKPVLIVATNSADIITIAGRSLVTKL